MTTSQLKLAVILAGMRIKWEADWGFPDAPRRIGRVVRGRRLLTIDGVLFGQVSHLYYVDEPQKNLWIGSAVSWPETEYQTEKAATAAVERHAFKRALDL